MAGSHEREASANGDAISQMHFASEQTTDRSNLSLDDTMTFTKSISITFALRREQERFKKVTF